MGMYKPAFLAFPITSKNLGLFWALLVCSVRFVCNGKGCFAFPFSYPATGTDCTNGVVGSCHDMAGGNKPDAAGTCRRPCEERLGKDAHSRARASSVYSASAVRTGPTPASGVAAAASCQSPPPGWPWVTATPPVSLLWISCWIVCVASRKYQSGSRRGSAQKQIKKCERPSSGHVRPLSRHILGIEPVTHKKAGEDSRQGHTHSNNTSTNSDDDSEGTIVAKASRVYIQSMPFALGAGLCTSRVLSALARWRLTCLSAL